MECGDSQTKPLFTQLLSFGLVTTLRIRDALTAHSLDTRSQGHGGSRASPGSQKKHIIQQIFSVCVSALTAWICRRTSRSRSCVRSSTSPSRTLRASTESTRGAMVLRLFHGDHRGCSGRTRHVGCLRHAHVTATLPSEMRLFYSAVRISVWRKPALQKIQQRSYYHCFYTTVSRARRFLYNVYTSPNKQH